MKKQLRIRLLLYILLAVVIYLILSLFVSFCDGYLMLNYSQHINIEFYVIPTIFIVILISLLILAKNRGFKKLVKVGISYLIILFLITWLTHPNDKAQLLGFRLKIKKMWNLEKLFKCSESLIEDRYIVRKFKPGYKIYKSDELPKCFDKFISVQHIKRPNVVVTKHFESCYITLEFENYSISIMPSGFPIVELLGSIRKGRIYFSYSTRKNKSWTKHNVQN